MRHQVSFKDCIVVSAEHEMALVPLILREFGGKYILIENSPFDHHSKLTEKAVRSPRDSRPQAQKNNLRILFFPT